MEIVNRLDIKTRTELRTWLMEHYKTEHTCWVPVKRGKPPEDGSLWYVDAVEEALCFGWIDSTLRRLPEGVSLQRLAPRSRNSHWAELNLARADRMERLGLMTEAGRAVLPERKAFQVDADILAALQADETAWRNFCAFPALYQRVRIDNIQSYRRNKGLFEKRLTKLITTARQNVMYGEWNDYGRLLPGGADPVPAQRL